MGANKDSLTPLKDIIADVLFSGKLPFNPKDADIWEVWDEVVGPAISGKAQPSWIRKSVLRVNVLDPIWLQELKFLETNIREKVNERLKRTAVERIDFRLGPK